MDVTGYYRHVIEACGSMYGHMTDIDLTDLNTLVTITATIIVILITVLHFFYKRIKSPIVIRVPMVQQNSQTHRFRKRDKMQFFARKVLRKGKDAATRLQRQASAIKEGVSIPEYSRSGRRLRKRERMYILAKRVFRVKREPPKLRKKELPSELLEAEAAEEQQPNLPEEVMYLLRSVKVFGHFEKGIFLQLCRLMEILKIEKGKYLFRIGDPDEYIYVIQEGHVNLYITEEGSEIKLSEFTAGESLHSLISILDVLTGHPTPYKTVFARALEDSTVIRLPVEAFNIAFKNRKESLVQVVQVVMTRMQRVTFLALHNYLGLSQQLLSPARSLVGTKKLSIHKLSQSRDSLGSLSSENSTENEENFEPAEDIPDAAVLPPQSAILEKIVPKTKSDPDKSKQLRFGEFDTIVDDQDNVFHRQSSLLPSGRNHKKLAEIIQATVQKDAFEEIDTTSRDSLGSLSSENSTENEENFEPAEDIPDAAVLPPQSAILEKIVPKTKSDPDKSKQLRFGEFDTIVDDQDNVFHRQSSLLPSGRNHKKLAEIIQATVQKGAFEEIDTTDLPKKFTHHRGSVMTASSSIDNEATFGIDRDRIKSQDSFEDPGCISELNEPEILDLVIEDMLALFGIDDREMLQENVTLLKVPQGSELIQEGDQDVSLYFVVTGALRVYQAVLHMDGSGESQDVTLFHALPGNLTGQLGVLTGEPAFFSVQSLKNSVVAKLSRNDFYEMMRHYPRMVLNAAHTVVQRVSKFTRQIDFALDWVMVEAGKALYKQDTLSDCMYIVLNGRMRSVHEKPGGKKDLVAEYGRGEIVGMMEALRGTKRGVSMHAVRDTELAKIPEGLLKHIRRRHPGIVSHLMSLASDKLIGTMMSSRTPYRSHPGELLSHKHRMAEETRFAYGDVPNHLANLSTIAVLPVGRDVPIDKFTMELQHALTAECDQILHLTSDTIKKRLGQNAFDPSQEYRLTGWLAQQEDLHRIVLYQTDDQMSDWTQRCIRQSDAILIVALGDGEPKIGRLEQQLENYSVRALKVLVLLHRPEVSQPTRTVEWLNMRGWLTEHLHIKASKRFFTPTRKWKLQEYQEKLYKRKIDRFSDFSRLARFLTGKSVALVLGGGGARGIAQIGIIKSLLEAGIPIDQVGGTSIGAFMGALWASHRDLSIVRSQTAIFAAEISSFLPQLLDLTYPITSMFKGAGFNRSIEMIFKDTQIEDLWLPYFAITTNITNPKMRVHTDGSLWRYVRGSMSLSGYLPPICDPKDGHLLMDGGYINNLPGDVARSRGANRVIAIDVGAATETDFTNYGDHLSGWWLLWKKWTGRWTGHIRVPDMNEIQSRLSYISCHYLMDLVIHSDYCTYLRPPVTKYTTLEFNKWRELLDLGYKFGKEVCCKEWADKFWKDLHRAGSENAPTVQENFSLVDLRRRTSIANLKGNMSFTDLSELLQKKRTSDAYLTDFSDADFEAGYESSPDVNLNRSLHTDGNLSDPGEPMSDVDGRVVNFHSLDDSGSSEDDEDIVKFLTEKRPSI